MPTYNDLRPEDDEDQKDYALVFPNLAEAEKQRTIENLLRLRAGLAERIATKKADHSLLISTWNNKEFGHTTQRLPEAYFYTAEIISRFDLVIAQEIKGTLKDLYIVMQILGDDWAYIVNDITEGTAGNSERQAFIYNKKRVEFAGLAGEIVLWHDLTQGSQIKQLKRTPFITGFRAGWKTFAVVNLHLQPGDSDEEIVYRREEVRLLLEAIEHKRDENDLWNENLILAGDFNLYDGPDLDDPTIELINAAGYGELDSLKGVDTNTSETEAYDRLFMSRNEFFAPQLNDAGAEVSGVFDFFDFVYRDGDEQIYKREMIEDYSGSKDLDIDQELTNYFKRYWRKNQISDHFPVWFELIIDSSDEFLQKRLDDFA